MKKNIIQFITLLVINELFANKGTLKNQKTILLVPKVLVNSRVSCSFLGTITQELHRDFRYFWVFMSIGIVTYLTPFLRLPYATQTVAIMWHN